MKETMLGYIQSQADMLRKIVNQRKIITKQIREVFAQYPIKKLILLGAGTSQYVAMAFQYYIEQYLPLEVDVLLPTRFTYYQTINKTNVYRKDEILILAFSQTGTSLNTVEALRKANKDGWHTAVLTAVENSDITAYAEYVLPLICGTEEIPPETRGFTSAVLTTYIWMLYLAVDLHVQDEKWFNEKVKELLLYAQDVQQDLDDCITWFMKNEGELMALEKGAVLGYGIHYITALEGNLKLAETFRKPIMAYEMEEFIHGPNMAFGKEHFIFLMLNKQHERERANDVITFFKPVTNHIFLISSNKDDRQFTHDLIFTRKFPVDLQILPYVMVFQLYAALACEKAGIDTSVFPFEHNGLAHSN